MGLQWVPKENALAQFLWSPSFWFYLCFPGCLPGWVSFNRPSPGESQIIETDECCPSNDVSLLSSVQFSSSVVSDSLRRHEPQHARPPCPSPTPRGYRNSCPLSQWCYPTISFSVVPFSSCPQSFPASGSFPMSRLFPSAKVLELYHQSFQLIFRVDFL